MGGLNPEWGPQPCGAHLTHPLRPTFMSLFLYLSCCHPKSRVSSAFSSLLEPGHSAVPRKLRRSGSETVVLVKGSSLLTGQSAWSRVCLDADVEFPRIPWGSVEEGDGGPSERFVSLDRVLYDLRTFEAMSFSDWLDCCLDFRLCHGLSRCGARSTRKVG